MFIKKSEQLYNVLLLPVDFVMLMAASLTAYFLRTSHFVADIRPVLFDLPLANYMALSAVVSVGFMLIFALVGLYVIKRSSSYWQEALRVIVAVSAGMTAIIVYMFFNLVWFDSRFIFLAGWTLGIVFVLFGRAFMRGLHSYLLHKKEIGAEKILILGHGETLDSIREQIESNKKIGFRLAGTLPYPDLTLITNIHTTKGIDRILATNSDINREDLMKVVNYCEINGITFSYVPDMFGSILADMSFDTIKGFPVVSVKPTPLDGWGSVLKRAIDIIGASAGLVLFAPLFAVFAFLIKWETHGPVLVKLKRISNGKSFYLYKFRSMVHNAEKMKDQLQNFNERDDGPLFKMKNDPRITKVGKFLRAHRFDEIPQLINVLRGEMSLVGPRPHEQKEIEQYKDYHKKVLAVKAGITGLAQVNGASDLHFDEEVKLDRYYIENWSLGKDIAIMFKTLRIFIFDSSGV